MPIQSSILNFCKKRDMSLLDYQKEVIEYVQKKYSGLITAPTGRGKTLSIFLPILANLLTQPIKKHCYVLWITPMRALAKDTTDQLTQIAHDLNANLDIVFRTSDTSSSKRAKIKQRLPHVLITTPESFSLLLSYPEVIAQLQKVSYCVVDEWHELLHTKRGIQTQLCISRLCHLASQCSIWGLSATLSNLKEAKSHLLFSCNQDKQCIISDDYKKKVTFSALTKSATNEVAWQGFMGTHSINEVEKTIRGFRSVLFFTNTRSQAERWYQLLIERFDKTQIRIHHSALDKATRQQAEDDLNSGKARCIVCTSGLDLGVDFQPVDHIIQCGSPKGIARFIQRAGRSGHHPTGKSNVSVIATHAFEWIELECLKEALENNILEETPALVKPIDVLMQHIITVCLAEPLDSNSLYTQITKCPVYADLLRSEWNWILEFLSNKHSVLRAYPQHCKLLIDNGTISANTQHNLALLHRFSIGTIYSEEECKVCLKTGKVIGSIEESFIKQLKPGQSFLFGGQVFQLVSFRSMTAIVTKSTKKASVYVRWLGGRMQLSTQLGTLMKTFLENYTKHQLNMPPILKSLLDRQREFSAIPKEKETLIELIKDRHTYKAVFYLFSGRLAHDSLGLLVCYRLIQYYNMTVSVQVNDYALMIQSTKPFLPNESLYRDLFSLKNLDTDIMNAINIDELASVKFKEVAQISGLHNKGLPGKLKSVAYSKSSAQLLYDLFRQYDPNNLLLLQSKQATLSTHINMEKIKQICTDVTNSKLCIKHLSKISPFAFPLLIEQLSSQLSNEALQDRVEYLLNKTK